MNFNLIIIVETQYGQKLQRLAVRSLLKLSQLIFPPVKRKYCLLKLKIKLKMNTLK